MEKDFAERVLSPETLRQLEPIRVVAAGPNAFVYFADTVEPVGMEAMEVRFPGAALELSRHPGVGFILARSGGGPICFYQGRASVSERPAPTGRSPVVKIAQSSR